MLSIDFGNSYTKVALRQTNDSRSTPLNDKSLEWDDQLNICIPTLAARISTRRGDRHFYGTDVIQHVTPERLATDGAKIYRNWKPLFFGTSHRAGRDGRRSVAVTGRADGSTVVLESTIENEYWQYVEKFRAASGTHPDQLISFAQWRALKSLQDAPAAADTFSPGHGDEAYDDGEIDEVAEGFFRWLRGFIEPLLTARGVEAVDQIPTRISLPSFGNQTAAEQRLVRILDRSGWRPADLYPVLHEPFANAIGVFTDGQNAVWRPRPWIECPNYRLMFGDAPIFQAMRAAARDINANEPYWAMVIDVGGFTTDFAMMGLDLTDPELRDANTTGQKTRATRSEAAGVQHLDEQVLARLPERKREALDRALRDPDQKRLETFRRIVYGNGRPFPIARGVAIADEPGERETIHHCLSDFAKQVADSAEEFMQIEQYTRIDELVLTGGGFNIPIIRDVVRRRLAQYHVRRTHMPIAADETADEDCVRISPANVRAATAIGGASIFFDYLDNDGVSPPRHPR